MTQTETKNDPRYGLCCCCEHFYTLKDKPPCATCDWCGNGIEDNWEDVDGTD